MPRSESDAFLADVAREDHLTLALLSDVVAMLDGLHPVARGQLPAAHGRYELVADTNKLHLLRHRLKRIVEAAGREQDEGT